MLNQPLTIADRTFQSRLMLGTGKFASGELMRQAIIASGTEIVTVALRRADLTGKGDPFANILDFIPKEVLLLPNTSGAPRPSRRGRWPAELGEAGNPSRSPLPPSGPD